MYEIWQSEPAMLSTASPSLPLSRRASWSSAWLDPLLLDRLFCQLCLAFPTDARWGVRRARPHVKTMVGFMDVLSTSYRPFSETVDRA